MVILLAEEGILPSTVREVMTPAPFVIHPEDSLEDALEIMVSQDFNHLPVVEKESPDRLVGFLTRTDILKAYTRSSHPTSSGFHSRGPGGGSTGYKQKYFVP